MVERESSRTVQSNSNYKYTNTNPITTMHPRPLKPQFKPKPLKSNPLILKASEPPSLQAFRTEISEFTSQDCIISLFKGICSVLARANPPANFLAQQKSRP